MHLDIGNRLTEIRRASKLTQGEVAERAEMPLQSISDLERGRINNPSVNNTLARIASALDIGIDELTGRGISYDPDHLPEGLRE